MAARNLHFVQIVETLAVGGLETMAVNLAIAHRAAGRRASIYTVFEPGALAGLAEANGVAVVPFHKEKGFSPSSVLRIAGRLRRDGASIVHTHNASIHHYGAAAGLLAGLPVVNTRHGLGLHSSPRQDVYFRAALPLTSAVVFVCDFGRRRFAQRGCAPAAKSHVILNGVPLERFQHARAAPGSVRPRIRFGTIGRFVEAKAHLDLLDAFAIVARELPEATLSMWGYGELQGVVQERLAALGLGGRAVVHGQAERSEAALQQLDVFVLASRSEGLPLVILEAMAAGLPVVTTTAGGIPEALPAAGGCWTAKAGHPPVLAAAMMQAAAADLAEAGETVYRHAAAHFGVDRMQSAYENLYRRVIG